MSAPIQATENLVDQQGAVTTAKVAQVGKFQGLVDGLQYASQIAGPATYYSMAEKNVAGADIVAASINAAATTSTSSTTYGGSTGLSTVSYGGSVSADSVSGSVDFGSGSLSSSDISSASSTEDMYAMAQEYLSESTATNIQGLMLQSEVQDWGRNIQLQTNIIGAIGNAEMSVARKVGGSA